MTQPSRPATSYLVAHLVLVQPVTISSAVHAGGHSSPQLLLFHTRAHYMQRQNRQIISTSGAGKENRTLISSLEGWRSTIELHLHLDWSHPHGEYCPSLIRNLILQHYVLQFMLKGDSLSKTQQTCSCRRCECLLISYDVLTLKLVTMALRHSAMIEIARYHSASLSDKH